MFEISFLPSPHFFFLQQKKHRIITTTQIQYTFIYYTHPTALVFSMKKLFFPICSVVIAMLIASPTHLIDGQKVRYDTIRCIYNTIEDALHHIGCSGAST
jgi:hypothetical protein